MELHEMTLECYHDYLREAHNALNPTDVKEIKTGDSAQEILHSIPFHKYVDELYISQIADGIVCFSGFVYFQNLESQEITIELNLPDCNELSISVNKDSFVDVISLIVEKDLPVSVVFHDYEYLLSRWVYKMNLTYIPLREYQE